MLIPVLFPSSEELLVSSCIFIISFSLCCIVYKENSIRIHYSYRNWKISFELLVSFTIVPMPVIVANECTELVLLNATLVGQHKNQPSLPPDYGIFHLNIDDLCI